MRRRYVIHFNPGRILGPIGDEWTVLDNPPEDEIFSGKKGQFQDHLVVLVQSADEPRIMMLAAARELLEVANEVKIVQWHDETPINEHTLLDAPALPRALLEMADEEFAALAEPPALPLLHPSQDYNNGVIYYGAIIQGQDKLVASTPEIFSLAAAQARGIALMQPELSMSNLRHDTVLEYFSGGGAASADRIFTAIRDYIRRHIYFPESETFDLVSVWVMGTYIFRGFRYYPYLHLNAEKGSGKTLLMELMSPIAFNGILLTQPAASTLIRLIHQASATLFIDEAEGLSERVSGGNSQTKQILKTGFARSGIYYIGDAMYRTYSPKCFAGINDLDDVLADRSVTIKMMRKTAAERVELYRETPIMRKHQMHLRDSLYLFGLQLGPAIVADYEGERPLYDKLVHLSNRAYDVWVPLYRIVSAFEGEDLKAGVFNSLDKLSQLDGARRKNRDAEENETGVLIQGLAQLLRRIEPLQKEGGIKFYDPDAVYAAMVKDEVIPTTVKKKGFSRLIKRTLDIQSVPRAFDLGTKRMYAFDAERFEEYKKRYSDQEVNKK